MDPSAEIRRRASELADRLSLPSIAVSRRCRTKIRSRARASSTASLTALAFDVAEAFAEPEGPARGAIEPDVAAKLVVEIAGTAADALPLVTVTSWANSEVSPSGSVAVALMNWPAGTDVLNVAVNEALPLASVVTVTSPR